MQFAERAVAGRGAAATGSASRGIFRQADVVKGRNRDTAWFSITDGEWPALKAAFERWLDPGNFDGDGRQRVSLSALTASSLLGGAAPPRRAGARPSGGRRPARRRATVIITMTLAPNTHRGAPWSMIKPNISGPTMPPMLNPLVTMPKVRPIAPGGAAARTSMSRDGMISPPSSPARAIADDQRRGAEPERADRQHDAGVDRVADRGDLGVAAGHVGDKAAGQHAERLRRQIDGQRHVGDRQRRAEGAAPAPRPRNC